MLILNSILYREKKYNIVLKTHEKYLLYLAHALSTRNESLLKFFENCQMYLLMGNYFVLSPTGK